MFKFKWGNGDARHTVSNLESPKGADGFIRQLRRGVAWRIEDEAGEVVHSGTGPEYPWWTL